MKITLYAHDLTFPLVEGVRKQAWWLATALYHAGHTVEIRSTSHQKKIIKKENITIIYGTPFSLSSCQTDVLHYLSHPSPLILPLLLRARARKQIITIFDGGLNGFWKRPWDFVLSPLAARKISAITVQTQFQDQLLKKTRLKNKTTYRIPPLIPHFQRTSARSARPTLLFMSHLSPEKGIEEVLDAFCVVRKQMPGIQLILCDSNIRKNAFAARIHDINQDDIILKEKVNPEEELSRAWIYLYPVRTAQETFSVPLSLIEATQVGTPYLATAVGGIPEYFPSKYLIPPKDAIVLAQKIVAILKSKQPVIPLLEEHNNEKTVAQFLKIYEK